MARSPLFPASRELFRLARAVVDARLPAERVSDADIGRVIGLESARTSRWKHGQIAVGDAARLLALSQSTGVDIAVLSHVAAGYLSAEEAISLLANEREFVRFLGEQLLLPQDGSALSMVASDGTEARIVRHTAQHYERPFRRGTSARRAADEREDDVVVLLADDDAATIEMFGNLTGRGTGLVGVVARSLPEALVTAGQIRPRLAIIDLFLGQADGFAALRALRTHEATSATELVATSLAATPDVARAAKGSGAAALLERPLRARPLGKLLRDLRRGT
ncbi:MAG: response regulator [Proteobacteria bacterium]|nr:response regulator [Pseudomonadota bacterium]